MKTSPVRALAICSALLLALPSGARAAFTSTLVSLKTVRMIGDAQSDTLTITVSGGLLRHNRFTAGDPGFTSDFDFDSTVAGEQMLYIGFIDIDAGDGNDTIAIGPGVYVTFVDGGGGSDTIDYGAYTSPVRVNLGLGTTGMTAALNASQENPPTTSTATGSATITKYDLDRGTFDISVAVSGILAATVNGIHIHRGRVGVNGPIIVDFGVGTLVPTVDGFTFSAAGKLPHADEAAFLSGGTYVNVHTEALTGGAIRGQLFSQGNVELSSGAATPAVSIVGVENVIGGSGDDSLVGSFAANSIHGGGGNDWLLGGPGGDTFGGGNGNDVLTWSNGDGSDLMEGGLDSDAVVVNGSVTGSDAFEMAASGARLGFDRVSAAPFSLDIGTVETLIVNGLGGDDAVVVNVLTGVASLAALGLYGFEGNDIFTFAQPSSDALSFNVNGGTGIDAMQGPHAANVWSVTGANSGTIAGLVTFTFMETLTGGSNIDVFNVKGFADGPLTVNGGAANDTLVYDAEFRTVSGLLVPPDGVIHSPGAQAVTFGQMETVTILNQEPNAPIISTIPNQTIPFGGNTGALPFTVGDVETPAASLVVSASSSNPTLVPVANIVLGGSGATRTVTVTAAANQAGTATITLTVADASGATASTTFQVTVNQPTTVQAPTDLYVSAMAGNAVTLRFTPSPLGPRPTEFALEGGFTAGQVLASLRTGSDAPIFTYPVPTGSFYVRIHAYRGTEKSPASNEIRIHVNVAVAPSAPDLFANATNGTSLAFSWRNTFAGGQPTSTVLDVTGAYTLQVPLGPGETFAAANVPAGTYTFRLRSVNFAGSSPLSPAVTVAIPSPCPGPPEMPSQFLAYRLGTSIYVVWEPPASGPAAERYTIDVTGSFTGTFQTTVRSASGQVGPGSYTITIRAVNACGSSPATPSQTIVVP
jgi:hypothetical protein